MGIPSDRRFLAVAAERLAHLFPELPKQSGYFKRCRRLAETLEWLMGMFARRGVRLVGHRLLGILPARAARRGEWRPRSRFMRSGWRGGG